MNDPRSTAGLYVDRDMEDVERLDTFGGRIAVWSRSSPVKESPNEDAAAVVAVDGRRGVIAVADGLGGMRSGATASRLAVELLRDAVCRDWGDGFPLRAAIVNGIEAANHGILQMGIGAATTVAVLEVDGRTIRPYHVGDSMILVTGGRGKIKWQTVCHSPVGFAVEAGVLDEDEAMYHKDRHLVSNVVGSPEMRIEIGPELHLAPRDTVLLASDGLFDNLTIDEIVARMHKGPLDQAVRSLAAGCRRRMTLCEPGQPSKPDDTTIVAFRALHAAPSRRAGLRAAADSSQAESERKGEHHEDARCA